MRFSCAFPISVLQGRLLLMATLTGEMLSRWTLELTSLDSSAILVLSECILTGKVVEIYGGLY